jgi:hypothetical protein
MFGCVGESSVRQVDRVLLRRAKSRWRVTNARAPESMEKMPRSVQYQVSTAELRSRIGGRSHRQSRVDGPSVAIVAVAMLTVPLAMWLISLLVKWVA